MAEQLYQWQTVRKVNNQWPLHDPDEVHPVQTGDQPVATLRHLKDKRSKDIDFDQTAWRLRRVKAEKPNG